MARNKSRRSVIQATSRTSNATMRRQRQPRVSQSSGVTTVTGSEIVATVGMSATGAFAGGSMNLNPLGTSLAGTWLNRQGTLFNKYKYVRASLRYAPFCPTNTQGRLTMAFIGDAFDTVPTSASQISQYQGSCEAPVWMPCQVNMGPSRKPEFTCSNQTGSDYTPGTFFYASDLGTTATGPGSLILDYTIQFWSRAAYSDNN